MQHVQDRLIGTWIRRVVTSAALSCAIALSAAPASAGQIAAVGDMGCDPNSNPSYNGGAGTATECRQRYVSDLLAGSPPNAVLLLGDTQYDSGQLANFNTVFNPTFGRLDDVIYPTAGNAEYYTSGASGYFDYFGNHGVWPRIAGSGDGSHIYDGYYSFDVDGWHIISLNSNCTFVGCASNSAQAQWLKSDLEAHPASCTLAYWHHPRFNTGDLGNDASTAAFWSLLYDYGADVVLGGHANHHYERFAPQNPAGSRDDASGLREFIVSTGGEHHGTRPASPRSSSPSQVSNYTAFGILNLGLDADGYSFSFVPENGGPPAPPIGSSFTDSGSGSCHTNAPGTPSLSAQPGIDSVSLSWTRPAHGGAAISAYNVYRGTTAESQTLLRSVDGVTSFEDSSAQNGATYYYRVAAVNSAGEGSRSAIVSATPSATPAPAPAPAPVPAPPPDPATGSSPTAKAPTELSVVRATIVRSRRLLQLVAPVAGGATGSAEIELAAAGHKTRFSRPIARHAIRVSRKISKQQADTGSGIVTIDYPGDAQTRALKVRLRAASSRPRLTLTRPKIVNGRLQTSGTIAARADGVVRVQLQFVHQGRLETLHFNAKIANGRWKLDRRLASSTLSQVQQRSGPLQSYTLYAGSRAHGISGELRAFRVLDEPM